MRVLGTLLLVSCASLEPRPVTAEPRPVTYADRAEVRRRFDEIVTTIDRNALELTPSGDSLTKQVYELLGHDSAVVLAVESDAWNASRVAGVRRRNTLDAPPEEQVIRFLHDLPQRNSRWIGPHGFALVSGAIVHEPDAGMGFNPWTRAVGDLDVNFETLVGDRPLRTIRRPAAQELFAALDVPDRVVLWGLADLDLAMALGEACAVDPEAADELLRRADRDRDDERLLVALGWCGTTTAVEFLEQRLVDLPPRDREMPWEMYRLKAATLAMRRASPDRLRRLVETLPVERSDAIVLALGGTELVMRRLAALDAAHNVAGRHDAIARLCRVDYEDAQMPSGNDAARLFRAYLEGVDSGDKRLREACLRAVETTLFGGYSGGGGGDSYGSNEGSIKQTDLRQRGSYCGPEALLRMIVEDLDAGRIVFFEHEDEPDGPRVPFLKEHWWPARGSAQPIPGRDTLPIHVTAEWVEGGLRLRLKNEHSDRVAVDVVGMRYGGVETVTETITYRGGPTLVRHPITLRLGWLGYAVVRESSLRVLEPGASYEWALPVRAEFRGRDEIDVANWGMDVLGSSTVPVVRFGMTVVK